MDFDAAITDPTSRFALAVFRVYGLLMRNGERITRSVGQSSAKWQVLGRAGHGPQTVAQMAREMGLARQSVQRVADALERDGLLESRPHPQDQRTYLVGLTDRGREVLGEIYAKNQAWAERLSKAIDPRRLADAAAILESLSADLENFEAQEEANNNET